VAAPRITGIPAAAAPIVAVVRRGPSAWTQIGRWDVEHATYEPGAWVRARVYEDRCDLSPDGRWLAYFTLRGSARPDWPAGLTYIALSRLPWMRALAAWSTCGTWTRGVHFVDDRRVWELGDPDVGNATPCRKRFGMKVSAALAYPVEHRRGWHETDDSPPREARGHWDEQIDALVMTKPRPGTAGEELRRAIDGYSLRTAASEHALPDVQWADWHPDGRLLVATTDGRLQIRAGEAVEWEHDLAPYEPAPEAPPPEAARW
jgi:hypothetical protein